MIAVDTNVLVRSIVEDDPRQAQLARDLLRSTVAAGEACFLSDPVLCELEWLLSRKYGVPRSEVLASVQLLFEQPTFAFEDRAAVAEAIERFQGSSLSLADCLIAARARARQVRTTYTFDRALARQPGFTLLA